MSGKPTYRIRDWENNYEVAQTRKVTGSLNWVAIPTKHDGKGYKRLMRRPDGPAVFAAWVLIVQVAAKCPTRGVLADSDGPLDADDLSDKTECPAEVFRNALNVLSDKSIGWLERQSVGGKWERGGSTVSHKQTDKQVGQTKEEPNGSSLPPNPPSGGDPPARGTGWSAEDVAAGKAVIAAWNSIPDVTAVVPPLSKARKASLKRRLRDAFWRANWPKAITAVGESEFCRGENDRGWRANFDWFLKPGTVGKLVEGQYAGKPRGHPQRSGQGSRFDFVKAFTETEGGGDDAGGHGEATGLPVLGDG